MRVVIWCGMLRWWTSLHHLMSRTPGNGRAGGRGGRDCHREKKRQVQRSLKHARLRSSSYGDLRSNQCHWPELSARPRSQADYVNRRQPTDLFLATTPLYHHTTVLIQLLSVALCLNHI